MNEITLNLYEYYNIPVCSRKGILHGFPVQGDEDKPVLFIIPGGSYSGLCYREDRPIALHFFNIGISSFYMTELERILKDTLDAQTRELGESLDRHQEQLDIQNRELMKANRELSELRQRLEESERHLMRLSSVYDSLKPLLEKLNSSLNAR